MIAVTQPGAKATAHATLPHEADAGDNEQAVRRDPTPIHNALIFG